MRWLALSMVVAMACGKVPGAAGEVEVDGRAPDGGADTRAIDLGPAEPIVGVHVGAQAHRTPRLVGQRLYFLADVAGGTGLFVAPVVDGGFGAPMPVATAGWEGRVPRSFALSADEREIIVEAMDDDDQEYDLYRAVRDGDGFGPLARLAVSAPGAYDSFPALLGDELFFQSTRGGGRRLYRAIRAPGGELDGAALITIDGAPSEGSHPWMAPDGHTLFYSKGLPGGASAVYRAVRDGDPSSFTGETELEALTAAGALTTAVSFSEDRVVFESNRPWSPSSLSLWQARVCRGAECPTPAPVPCDGGRVSDQRGCTVLVPEAKPWAEARAACEARGMRLASVHSRAELDWLLSIDQDVPRIWIGGNDMASECNKAVPGCRFEWVGGEPFLYAPWFDTVNPDDSNGGEDCLELVTDAFVREAPPFTPGLNDVGCTQAKPFLCERYGLTTTLP